jgi:ubiquitin C-terminal hydrolase
MIVQPLAAARARPIADLLSTNCCAASASSTPCQVLHLQQSQLGQSHAAAGLEANDQLIARLARCLDDEDDDDEPILSHMVASGHSGNSEVSQIQSQSIYMPSSHSPMGVAAYKVKTPFWSLCNPGNLCFLNSLLQNLARLSPLMISLEKLPGGARHPSDADAPLASAFNRFCSKVNLDGYKSMQAAKTTEAFHRVLPDLITAYASGRQRQQDAHEVLLRLIEKLDQEGRTAGLRYFNIFTHAPTQHFGHPLPAICSGLVEQEMTCSGCSLKSVQKEAFVCLSIPIPFQAEVSVESMMSAYFARHQVQYRCSKCDGTAASVQQRVGVWPTVLAVHFLRWRGASKISTQIKMPLVWSFPADMSCPKYKLNGYILHHGPQANVGHYTAVVMVSVGGSDEYHRISDDLIDTKPIEKSAYCHSGFPSTTCYLAFYVQM